MSGAPVDAECGDIVASRVANIQEVAIRLDGKVAWIVSLRPELLQPGERAVAWIYAQHGDGIVKPVRGIDETPVSRDVDLRRIVSAFVARRKSRQGLLQRQRTRA